MHYFVFYVSRPLVKIMSSEISIPCPSPESDPKHLSNQKDFDLETSTAAITISIENANDATITRDDFEFFTIQPNPNHGGQSPYAKQFIPRHTIILLELPYICGNDIDTLTHRHHDGIIACQADDDAFLREQVGLDEEQRRTIWDLHDQFVDVAKFNPNGDEKRLLGIIKTNAYLSTDMGGLGLYPIISRFNHSCTPNVGYGFDGWQVRMYTTRDIEAGEELTVCYSDVVYFHPREFRQAYLRVKGNFDCICVGCNPNPNATEHKQCNDQDQDYVLKEREEILRKSDERRSRLKFLSQMLSIRDEGRIKRSHLQMILESIRLLHEEGLEHNLAPTYQIAYEWARKLKEMGQMEIDEDLNGFNLGRDCLSMLEISMGVNHAKTKAFRSILDDDAKQ